MIKKIAGLNKLLSSFLNSEFEVREKELVGYLLASKPVYCTVYYDYLTEYETL